MRSRITATIDARNSLFPAFSPLQTAGNRRSQGDARVLALDPKTLRRHYRAELDTGQIKATAKVAEFLFRKATTEGPQCVTAAIFWMKTRGGWRETPQEHKVVVTDLTQLSDQDLERMILFYQDEIARQEGKTLTLEPVRRV